MFVDSEEGQIGFSITFQPGGDSVPIAWLYRFISEPKNQTIIYVYTSVYLIFKVLKKIYISS